MFALNEKKRRKKSPHFSALLKDSTPATAKRVGKKEGGNLDYEQLEKPGVPFIVRIVGGFDYSSSAFQVLYNIT